MCGSVGVAFSSRIRHGNLAIHALELVPTCELIASATTTFFILCQRPGGDQTLGVLRFRRVPPAAANESNYNVCTALLLMCNEQRHCVSVYIATMYTIKCSVVCSTLRVLVYLQKILQNVNSIIFVYI